jgi:hypothetical protein
MGYLPRKVEGRSPRECGKFGGKEESRKEGRKNMDCRLESSKIENGWEGAVG